MEKFSHEYFRALAKDLRFELNDKEIEGIKKRFKRLENQIELFEQFDTDNVEPMVYPFETPTTYLREDEVDEVLSQAEVLSNVKDARMGHVHVPKVVK